MKSQKIAILVPILRFQQKNIYCTAIVQYMFPPDQQRHANCHSSMVYPKFIIPEEKIFEIDDSRPPLFNSCRRSHPWQRSCFFLQANCFLLRLQSSFLYSSSTALCPSLFISIINGFLFSLHSSLTAVSIFFFSPTSTIFSSDFKVQSSARRLPLQSSP